MGQWVWFECESHGQCGRVAAMDRVTLERSLAAAPDARGNDALGALEVARWFDAAVLWVGWRLRPRHLLADR